MIFLLSINMNYKIILKENNKYIIYNINIYKKSI